VDGCPSALSSESKKEGEDDKKGRGPKVCGVGVLLCGWSGVFPMTVACRPRRSHTIGNGAPPHYVWHRYWPVYTLGYLSNKKRALWTPPRDPPGPPPGPIGRLFLSILDFGSLFRSITPRDTSLAPCHASCSSRPVPHADTQSRHLESLDTRSTCTTVRRSAGQRHRRSEERSRALPTTQSAKSGAPTW
jgi:hypothetical protein